MPSKLPILACLGLTLAVIGGCSPAPPAPTPVTTPGPNAGPDAGPPSGAAADAAKAKH